MDKLKSLLLGRIWITILSVFLLSAGVVFIFLWERTVQVTLEVDDIQTTVLTKAKHVEELLAKEGIQIGEHDLLWPEEGTKIIEDMHILVKRAWPITLKIGPDFERSIFTTARTVEGVLKEHGYQFSTDDIIFPYAEGPIFPNQRVEVVSVTHEVVEKKTELKFDTVRKADNTMIKGSEKVVHPGKTGEIAVTYITTLHNGVPVNYEPLKSTFIEDPEEQVIAYGTLEPVTIGGLTFIPQKTLTNVRLTAYGPGVVHTGKTPDHPGYGITRSGVRAEEGRTVAVDSDLIPLGSWIYIDGFGLYRAEDTGGAVKGKIIDIFYEDDDKATDFGVKRGYTVYVIGKDKPE